MTAPAGFAGPAAPAYPGFAPAAPAAQPGFVQHPTMPYGQQPPAAAPAAPAYPGQPGYGQPAPPAAPQPHPTVSFGQPGVPQPGQPPAPQGGMPAGFNPNAVIQPGPGVPPELVGRTMGQAFAIYSALATDYVTRRQGQPPQGPAGQQPQGGQPQGQPQGGQPPAGQPPATPPGQLTEGSRKFFADPDGYMNQFEQKLMEKVTGVINNNPATQAAQQNNIRAAAQTAAQGIPDFQALMPLMAPILQSVDQNTLADPRTWGDIADIARGRAMRSGQYAALVQPQPGQPAAAPAANPNGAWQAAGGNPNGAVPATANPLLPQFTFFSEQPTASGNTHTGMPTLTAEQQDAAKKFGMSQEQYVAWMGGVKRG